MSSGMKVFLILSSLLASAFAVYNPYAIPKIGHTGVPLESPEIVHARQAHLSHIAAVKSKQGAGGYLGGYGDALGYGFGYNGGPIDTPEVQAAKAAHFAAYNKVAVAAAGGEQGLLYRKRRSIFGFAQPIIGHNGVPIDTPEVQAAKAAHFAAHTKAASLAGGFVGAYTGAGYGGFAGISENGLPLETPEVIALKNAHFAAHAEALSRVGPGVGLTGGYGGGLALGLENGYYGVASSQQGYHIPVIGYNGVPIDTPEVQAARKKHLTALAEASVKSGGFGEGREYY